VEILEAAPESLPARVLARGVVEPSQRVSLSAEVAGRIIEVSPQMRPGGRVKEGQVLARIDPRNYRLLIEAEQSRVRAAEAEAALERGRQAVARREYELLGKGSPDDNPLALRKPQLAAAEQALEAARSGLEKARLDLARTEIRAPFDAVIARESVEVGRVVSPGAEIAEIIGSEAFWVRVSVPVEDLAVLSIPGVAGASEGAVARVADRLAGTGARAGRVIGMEGELDTQTRTAMLLVEVPRPLDPEQGLPLLAGTFVEAELSGVMLEDVVRVPRPAVVEGDRVWIVGPGGTLERRTVRIAWRTREEVIVREGLAPGERVVVSPLSLPVEGMKVEVTGTVRPAAPGELSGGEPAAPPPL
jgi:RND family efflux transporter MFP subunit